MREEEQGFTTTELMLVIAALAVIMAMAVPSVVNSIQDYRLHNDLSTVASLSNVARLRAAAEFAPLGTWRTRAFSLKCEYGHRSRQPRPALLRHRDCFPRRKRRSRHWPVRAARAAEDPEYAWSWTNAARGKARSEGADLGPGF